MRRWLILVTAAMLVMALPGAASADHEHFGQPIPASNTTTGFVAGPDGAEWEIVASFLTPVGDGFSDLDFFTQGGETYVAVGTLAAGLNAGQSVFRLTTDGEVDPAYVSAHPSASCLSDPAAALGLQHDVEATPKGDLGLNTVWGEAGGGGDAQLLIDATDNGGRCHDQGPFGTFDNPQGGLEIVDVTDIENPVEIALTSHIGEAHTVNVDPRRPHIAYAVTSDGVPVRQDEGDLDDDGDTEEPIRENEDPEDSDRFDLDGFEVVDLSSCMDLPADATVEQKRGIDESNEELAFHADQGCRPEVFRYRFDFGWTLGTFDITQTGCHELAIHPNDIVSCAAPNGTMLLDMSGAFDAEGKPRGEPLPCRIRESNTSGPTHTAAPVIDCVEGEDEADLTVPGWLDMGAPSLEGVELIGFVNHGGRDQGNNASHSPEEDIAVSHEAELTHSGDFVFASDERGGGVVPPDAACSTPGSQPAQGNGGLHAFSVDRLLTEYPGDPLAEDPEPRAEQARQAYAQTPDGEKAIYRATPRIPAASFCTAHVFQQIPGQNRLFMGWYSQGTQVVDYIEHADGTFEWQEAGWFIPEFSNTWTSAVFDFEENDDGTWTYWGVATNFLSARSGIDVWKVTMPAPPQVEEPAPAPEPEPEPAPAPEEEPMPVTGGGLALVSLILFGGASALVARQRRRSR